MTTTNNGVTTTDQEAPGSTIYVNVPGVCVVGAPNCLPLTYYTYQLCAVDGKFVTSSYSSTVSGQSPLPAGCTGSDVRTDIITSYTFSGSGLLSTTYETKQAANRACNIPVNGTVDHTTYKLKVDNLQTINYNLSDGSGNGSISGSTSALSMDSLSGNSSESIASSGSVTWPGEKSQPPQFAASDGTATGIGVTYTNVPPGQARPQLCVPSAASSSAITRARGLRAISSLEAAISPLH